MHSRTVEIKVKINAPEILKKELQKRIDKNKPKEPVSFGSISDHYQLIIKDGVTSVKA